MVGWLVGWLISRHFENKLTISGQVTVVITGEPSKFQESDTGLVHYLITGFTLLDGNSCKA
jgi:hypothetical protein